jgi:hypothetical protein
MWRKSDAGSSTLSLRKGPGLRRVCVQIQHTCCVLLQRLSCVHTRNWPCGNPRRVWRKRAVCHDSFPTKIDCGARKPPLPPTEQKGHAQVVLGYSAETIELCVRWYTTYRLSYRDLAAMMAEREVIVAHTTIMRWVLQYVPEYERRWARFAQPPGGSWRVDETAVSVRGGRHYLFRGVDKNGKSIGSLLCNDRDMESAQAFFRAVVDNCSLRV